jgi:hypothetical protein
MGEAHPCRVSVTLTSIPGMGYDRTALCERDQGHRGPDRAFVRAPGGEARILPQWFDVVWKFPAIDGGSKAVGEVRPKAPSVPHRLTENDIVDGPNRL